MIRRLAIDSWKAWEDLFFLRVIFKQVDTFWSLCLYCLMGRLGLRSHREFLCKISCSYHCRESEFSRSDLNTVEHKVDSGNKLFFPFRNCFPWFPLALFFLFFFLLGFQLLKGRRIFWTQSLWYELFMEVMVLPNHLYFLSKIELQL